MTAPLPALARQHIAEGKRVRVYRRTSKVCPVCGIEKPVSANKAKSGYSFKSTAKTDAAGASYIYVTPHEACKMCFNARDKQKRDDPRERKATRIRGRVYARTHREQIAAKFRRYRKTGKVAAQQRKRAAKQRLEGRAPLVLRVVATYYDLTIDDLLHPATRSREDYSMEARAVAAFLLGPSWGHIGPADAGRLLNLDHSTILHHQERLSGNRGSYEERTAKKECRAELRKLWAPRTRARDKKRQRAA